MKQCNYMIDSLEKHRQCKRFGTVKLISEGVQLEGKGWFNPHWLVMPGSESWLCPQHAKIVLRNKNSWHLDKQFRHWGYGSDFKTTTTNSRGTILTEAHIARKK